MIRRTGQCFLIYSFLGWVLEGVFHFAKEGTFHKPNFLHGPVKPMYGFAGVLLAGSFRYDHRHFFYHACLLPLVVEYISAWWLERRYALRYWDYSREPLQMDGRICLKFALCWVVLAQVVVYMVQPLLNVFLRIAGRLSVWKTLFRVFLADCVITMHQRRNQCKVQNTIKQIQKQI